MTSPVWCLIIDHNCEPLGRIFDVEPGKNVSSLRRAVKQENPVTLKDVDPAHLTVLRGVDTTAILDYNASDDLNQRVLAALSIGYKELSPQQTIASLAITDEEALLIQLAGVLHALLSLTKANGAQALSIQILPRNMVSPYQHALSLLVYSSFSSQANDRRALNWIIRMTPKERSWLQ